MKYSLTKYQQLFMDTFKETHNYKKALAAVPKTARPGVKASLLSGLSDLSKAYQDFVNNAPLNPRANKASILQMYFDLYDKAIASDDVVLMTKILPEINKMVKGNLAAQSKDSETKTKMIGMVIDMTKKDDEPLTIDITTDG